MTITDAQIEAAFLVALAEANITPDIGELLVRGDPAMGVAPGALRKALVTAERAAWRPIEEAPKDGSAILGWNSEYGARETRSETYRPGSPGYAQGLTDRWWTWDEPVSNWAHRWKPTHFRPLPTPGEPDEH